MEQEKQATIKDAVERLETLRESIVISYIANSTQIIEPADELALDDNLSSLKPKDGKIKKLDLFLHSYGGFMDVAYKFVKICRNYSEEFNVIVPFMAKSAATAICLGADEIVMTSIAELGPIDPIIQHPYKPNIKVPARAVEDFFEYVNNSNTERKIDENIKNILINQFDPYLIGTYKGALKSSQQYAEKLLSSYMLKNNPEKIPAVVKKLTEHYVSHSHAIDREEAKNELGLNVVFPDSNKELLDAIKQLFSMYNAFMTSNGIVKLQGTKDINRNVQIITIQPPQNLPVVENKWE